MAREPEGAEARTSVVLPRSSRCCACLALDEPRGAGWTVRVRNSSAPAVRDARARSLETLTAPGSPTPSRLEGRLANGVSRERRTCGGPATSAKNGQRGAFFGASPPSAGASRGWRMPRASNVCARRGRTLCRGAPRPRKTYHAALWRVKGTTPLSTTPVLPCSSLPKDVAREFRSARSRIRSGGRPTTAPTEPPPAAVPAAAARPPPRASAAWSARS